MADFDGSVGGLYSGSTCFPGMYDDMAAPFSNFTATGY